MTKRSGLGMGAVYGGYDLANDIGNLTLGGGPALLEQTGINKSAHERIGGLLDGRIDLGAFFNDAVGQAHPVLSALPTTDRQMVVFLASTIGAVAGCLVGKQIDYSGTRGADGALMYSVPHPANGYGFEFANLLTAGYRTDTAGTNGASLDGAAASSTGWAAYLQVLALTGTNVVVTLQDSANDSAFATFTGSAFTSATAARTVQRIQGATGSTVRRYVRAVTSGTFSSATFIVALTRQPVGS
jgi:hypothetical protein